MKIAKLETFVISIPYLHAEVSSRVHRAGVTNVIVKLTTDDGLVGWGESCSGADVESINQAVLAARPFLIGRSPWQTEAIAKDYFKVGLWDYRAMSGNFAFAGIDQALWDLCGKSSGQPIYRLFGGSMREAVNYFYYLSQGTVEEIERQCLVGVQRGYTCFYLKVGIDSRAETEMIAAIRRTIGPNRKIRIDANEAWSVPEAVSLITEWHSKFNIDFCEAPVCANPIINMNEVRNRVPVAICANEGLSQPHNVLRMIENRGADVLCFSSYWVGTMRRFHTLSQVADLAGLKVVKHTHGETGIAAAAMQHMMLSIPNALDGVQNTAHIMEGDILKEDIPIVHGPTWECNERPGLGIEVDEYKLQHYHENYLKVGQYLPFLNSSEA